MGPRCSSAETQVCHRSYIIAAREGGVQDGMFPSHFQKRVGATCFGIFFLETFEIWTWKQKMCAVKHEIKDYKCMF